MTRATLLISLTISLGTWSQETILEWQEHHPEVLLMKESTYRNLSVAMKTNLDGRVVIYTETLKLEDLEAFSPVQVKTNNVSNTPTEDDEQFVKDWLGTHQHVKIVPRSVFDASDSDQKQAYLAAGVLVLTNEKITASDILNYHP